MAVSNSNIKMMIMSMVTLDAEKASCDACNNRASVVVSPSVELPKMCRLFGDYQN
jgi:hypothetical protein